MNDQNKPLTGNEVVSRVFETASTYLKSAVDTVIPEMVKIMQNAEFEASGDKSADRVKMVEAAKVAEGVKNELGRIFEYLLRFVKQQYGSAPKSNIILPQGGLYNGQN